jgi:hypothetical protein
MCGVVPQCQWPTITKGPVLATAILAAIGKLGVAWHWLVGVAGTVWQWVTSSVTVPMWLLLLAGGILVLRLVRLVRSLFPLEVEVTIAPPSAAPASLPRVDLLARLDALETTLLRHLAKADGESLQIRDFQMAAQEPSQLRIERALEHIEKAGLGEWHRNVATGPRFALTRDGRDRVIAKGWV